MDFFDAQKFLLSLGPNKVTYGIDRMRLFTSKLKSPEKEFSCIHVAGTNGKGSVCAMLEAIYRTAGFKTGLFTSPHLVYVNERIKINGTPIPNQTLATYTEEILPISQDIARTHPSLQPSFFEFINAIAFLYFAREKVDIAIVETGLGGEFDATNIVHPLLSVITTISKDHTEILGNSIEAIARAKAGIIKHRVPVVMGRLPNEAETIIKAVVAQQESPLFSINERFETNASNKFPTTNLIGSFQRHNAAIATLAVESLSNQFPVTANDISLALQDVHWPARFQFFELKNNKTLILDATHNEGGCPFLSENLHALIQKTKTKPIILVGALANYRAEAILATVAEFASEIVLLTPPIPQAIPANELIKYLPKTFKGKVHAAVIDEIFLKQDECTLGNNGSTIIATGSIYLAGAIFKCIKPDVMP